MARDFGCEPKHVANDSGGNFLNDPFKTPLMGSLPWTDFGAQETSTGVQDRLLPYCTSEKAGQRGISGPCLKMLRFFVKHSCANASTRCLFLTK